MKIALTIEQGRRQIVLTPEDDDEKAVLAAIRSDGYGLSVTTGRFYQCHGGYSHWSNYSDDMSTIIVMDRKAPEGIQT